MLIVDRGAFTFLSRFHESSHKRLGNNGNLCKRKEFSQRAVADSIVNIISHMHRGALLTNPTHREISFCDGTNPLKEKTNYDTGPKYWTNGER